MNTNGQKQRNTHGIQTWSSEEADCVHSWILQCVPRTDLAEYLTTSVNFIILYYIARIYMYMCKSVLSSILNVSSPTTTTTTIITSHKCMAVRCIQKCSQQPCTACVTTNGSIISFLGLCFINVDTWPSLIQQLLFVMIPHADSPLRKPFIWPSRIRGRGRQGREALNVFSHWTDGNQSPAVSCLRRDGQLVGSACHSPSSGIVGCTRTPPTWPSDSTLCLILLIAFSFLFFDFFSFPLSFFYFLFFIN